MFETQFGNIAKEISTRFGRPQSDLPVFGVDRFIGITPTTKYASKDLSKYKIVKPGMFVYNPMRLNIGSIGLCTTHHGDGLVSPDYVVFAPLSGKIDPVFLCYYIKTLQWSEWVAMAGEGSVRERIYFRNLARNTIKIPEFPDQLKIAAILRMLDDKIELNRKTAAVLEEMARALYRSWFVDFDPVWAKAEGHPPAHMDTATAALFPDGFDDEGLPLGWAMASYLDLIDIISGGTPKTSEPTYWGGDIPWYSVVDAPAEGQVFVLNTEKTITDLGVTNSAVKLIKRGTTIISARGTVGKLAMAAQAMVFNQSCYGLTGRHAKMDAFTYFATARAVEQLQSMAHGSVFSTITRKTFEGVSLMQCTPDVLGAFEKQVSGYLDRILSLGLENQTLATLRDSLLPRLMSGELRVGAARDMLEQVA